jgi:ABC-type branched-subunit amino acid transport system ATPase component
MGDVGPATNALSVVDLRVRYQNGAEGIQGVSLRVPEHSTVAVLGRNGAGKTSLLRGISGFLRSEHVAVSGLATVGAANVAGMTPSGARRKGVVMVAERDKIFPSLTIAEHFRMIAPSVPKHEAIGGFDALERRWKSRAGLLSGGERQMLALAVAWLQHPTVLLVDELSLGLAPVIIKSLLRRLKEMTAETGIATLLVEQDAATALQVADYVYLLDRGKVVWEGESGSISPEVLGREYLGTML